MWVCKPGTCTEVLASLWVQRPGEKEFPLFHRAGQTQGQESAGMAPALGMGLKDWTTPSRSEKPTLWMMSPSEGRE